MSRISTVFNRLREKGRRAFIPFLMAGDPDMEMCRQLVLAADKRGADIIELGIPYSAPLADGPTIQKAGKRSLNQGTNLNDIFKLVKEIRVQSQIPLVLMGYYNLIYNYGVEEFVAECIKNGVDGLIIPDLPLEENLTIGSDLDIILLVAPTTTEKRLKKIAGVSTGFIYAVSSLGTTGTRKDISREIEKTVVQVQRLTETPVAVGFGISRPGHVKDIAEFADGVIVGSAIIEQIEANLKLLPDNRNQFIREVGDFISTLISPL